MLAACASRFGSLAARVPFTQIRCASGVPSLPTPSLPTPPELPAGPRKKTNLLNAINNAMEIALATNPKCYVFGEDVAFGGVFRASTDLLKKFGPERVFNTPLCEQGIAAFAIGMAAIGHTAVAEIQFADYIFPAFDQIVNEAAKYRYRSGNQFNVGGLTFRTPYGVVGHGGHYHSQSPEGFFTGAAGLKVVFPRSPCTAKGLLLSCIRDPNPCLFFEPKVIYRAAVEEVPVEDYMIPLGKAEVVKEGKDVTIVSYGRQVLVCAQAAELAAKDGISCEIVDLRTVIPWDQETVYDSVKKTGKCIVSHEASITSGFGAELASSIQENCFLHLEAPVARVCGVDTPVPMMHEPLYLPDAYKVYEAIKATVKF